MTDVILARRGTLLTNARFNAYCVEIQPRLRPGAFTAGSTQVQAGFYRGLRDMLTTLVVSVEPRGLAWNDAISSKVINTIWKVPRPAIANYFKRIRRRLPRDPTCP